MNKDRISIIPSLRKGFVPRKADVFHQIPDKLVLESAMVQFQNGIFERIHNHFMRGSMKIKNIQYKHGARGISHLVHFRLTTVNIFLITTACPLQTAFAAGRSTSISMSS